MTTPDTRERIAFILAGCDQKTTAPAVLSPHRAMADAILAAFPALAPAAGDVETAREIAQRANDCCSRSDGYEGHIAELVLAALTARAAQAEALRKALARLLELVDYETAMGNVDFINGTPWDRAHKAARAALGEPRHES